MDAAMVLPLYVEHAPPTVDFDPKLATGGAISIRVAGQTLAISTRTSEPNGQWLQSSTDDSPAAAHGSVRHAHWKGTTHKVDRTITVLSDHIHVTDTISNSTAKLLGVIVEHRLTLSNALAKRRLLGGRKVFKAQQRRASPGNPTAIVESESVSVGLAADDDVFRVQSEEFSEPDAVGLADRRLALPPNSARTLEWDVYVSPGDYWDVINALRRNRGSNFTIPGPLALEPMPDGKRTPDEYRTWLDARRLQVVVSGQTTFKDGSLAEGTAIPLANEWCNGARNWITKIASVRSDVRTLVYLHSQISTEPGAVAKYADARLYDASGAPILSPYREPLPLYVATETGSYGRALTRTAQFLLDDLGAAGIYNDAFSYDTAPFAYTKSWDGCTVEIDAASHTTERTLSSVTLLQQPWKVNLARMVAARKKLLVGNGPLETRTALQLRVPTFVETISYSSMLDAHLSAPWGLGNHDLTQSPRARATMARRILDYGGVYCTYEWRDEPTTIPFVEKFYPITPIEIREGVVIGKERIITNRSGLFGWLDDGAAEPHVFDADGAETSADGVKLVQENGRTLVEVRLKPDEFAVLVKRPSSTERHGN
jgi:hypothetical protein